MAECGDQVGDPIQTGVLQLKPAGCWSFAPPMVNAARSTQVVSLGGKADVGGSWEVVSGRILIGCELNEKTYEIEFGEFGDEFNATEQLTGDVVPLAVPLPCRATLLHPCYSAPPLLLCYTPASRFVLPDLAVASKQLSMAVAASSTVMRQQCVSRWLQEN